MLLKIFFFHSSSPSNLFFHSLFLCFDPRYLNPSQNKGLVLLIPIQNVRKVHSTLNELGTLKIRNLEKFARACQHGPCPVTRAPVLAFCHSPKLFSSQASWHGPCPVTRAPVSAHWFSFSSFPSCFLTRAVSCDTGTRVRPLYAPNLHFRFDSSWFGSAFFLWTLTRRPET